MATLNNPEWRDYIDEDTKLVIDLDTFVFMAASSQEEDVMTVTHIETGDEWFIVKDEPVFEKVCINQEAVQNGDETARYADRDTGDRVNKKFKNKSEFWGRTKVKVTGWLGTQNEKREIEDLPPYTREMFDLSVNKVVKTNAGAAVNNLKRKVQEVTDFLGIDECMYIIGGGDNHRHELKLPLNLNKPDIPHAGRYKGQRGDKPLLLDEVRKYCVNVMKSWDVTDTFIEADDAFNFLMVKSHKHFKKTGKHLYIGVASDKDALSFNGLIFNPFRMPKSNTWKHPTPYLVDGLGALDLREGKIHGKGLLWLMVQITLGDTADNYLPTRHAKIKFGDVAAYELLYACKTPKEAIKAVYDQYQTWYPEGTQFTAWDSTEQDMTAMEWLETMFECAYMLKHRKDKTKFADLMKFTGVEHNGS
jgi:hypothetical protein